MFRPLNDLVLIETATKDADKKSAGGIYIPPTATEDDITKGKVLGVGPDAKGVKDGDQVLFDLMEAIEVNVKEQKLLLVSAKNILGILE